MTFSTLANLIRHNRHSLLSLTAGLTLSATSLFGQAPPSAVSETAQIVAQKSTTVAPAAPELVPECVPATPATPVIPFGGPLFERPKLTGDWLGLREEMRNHGVTLDASATGYYQGTAAGGIQDGFTFSGRADYLLNIDGEKAGLWKGLFVNLHAETVFGPSINSFTGALMPVNTGRAVPVPQGDVTALTGVKVTQALSENFAVFAGKINMFDGFKQPFMQGTGLDAGFMNLANIFPAVAYRTIPYSTWGAGGAILYEGQPVATVMVVDTNNTPTTSGFNTFFNNGAVIVAMAGLPSKFFGMPGQHMFGGTYSSGSYVDTDRDSYSILNILNNFRKRLPLLPRINGSYSVFYQGQQTLWTDPCDSKRSWGMFWSGGISDGNPNPIRWSANAGFAGASPIPGRDRDTFGASYFYLGLSDDIKNLAPRLLKLRDEQGVELFYNAAVTPWCQFTPNLQVVIPGRSDVNTVIAVGVRARLDF